ncbi:hypothetical protein Y032_0154g2995 [Ancylostoma ceylanicum]|uniref:Reverse transcriptase domain-containing protein n=1 Tax=Ancylostoma ceylanicum TaxID=53326 RepID=A0A016SZ66_9BILA|nr:hypothetical protein Y032_0154g2995 [Ancylostoma ceylanicum]
MFTKITSFCSCARTRHLCSPAVASSDTNGRQRRNKCYGVHGSRRAPSEPGWCEKYARVLDASRTVASGGENANRQGSQRSLRLNVKKTEYMSTNLDELSTIQVDGNDLRRTDYFKYLGSTLSADGNPVHEVVARVNATWLKWRSMTGVLCDKNIPDRFKSKVYRAVVRSVALYGAECWPATKEVERRLSVMETKMLRWTAGVTRADRIRNEKIRERFGIAPIADKLRETRLRWYVHVLRSNEDTICKVDLDLEVLGKRPKGRPKQRWLDTLHADLKHVGVHPDQAHDRVKWRQKIRKADPATKRD